MSLPILSSPRTLIRVSSLTFPWSVKSAGARSLAGSGDGVCWMQPKVCKATVKVSIGTEYARLTYVETGSGS